MTNFLSQNFIKFLHCSGCKNVSDEWAQYVYKSLNSISISFHTSFAEFCLWSGDVLSFGRFCHRLYDVPSELYNAKTSYLEQIQSAHEHLGLPEPYIPLDSFEGGGGFFYNRETGEVLELEFGEMLNDFHAGKLKPQFKDFNIFLEWFFELRDDVPNTSLDYEKARHEANLKHEKQAQIRLERKLAQKKAKTERES